MGLDKKTIKTRIVLWGFKFVSMVSPELNVRLRYFLKFHKKLNLSNPTSFIEKLLYLKVKKYNHSIIVKQCADKYAVRKYVTEILGDDILIPMIASYDNVDDVSIKILPNEFVIKWNFGCGFNIICKDKEYLDEKEIKKKLNRWKKDTSHLLNAEMQYHNVKKKIMVEKFMKNKDGNLPSDYKFYCFNGEPLCVLFIDGRDTDSKKGAFFDTNWKFISVPDKGCYSEPDFMPERPKCFDVMLESARKLSKPFDFVRIDFYNFNGKAYFGEMTFTPASGLNTSECVIDGKSMGDLLTITPDKLY